MSFHPDSPASYIIISISKCHFNYSLSVAYVMFFCENPLLTMSVIFNSKTFLLLKICQCWFQNLDFLPKARPHQTDMSPKWQQIKSNECPPCSILSPLTSSSPPSLFFGIPCFRLLIFLQTQECHYLMCPLYLSNVSVYHSALTRES